jgi:acetyl-CoA acetyltransferase
MMTNKELSIESFEGELSSDKREDKRGQEKDELFMRFMGMQAEKVFIEKDKVTAEKDKFALEVQRVATEARRSGKRGKSINSCMLHKTVYDLLGQHNPHGSEDDILV